MKRILNKIIAGTFVIAIAGFTNAQKIDAKSKSLLESVSANYKSKKNSYFKFVYGTGNGKVTKTEPGIFYSTPSQYKLKILGTEQIFDGNKVYSINAEDSEITIAKPNGSEAMFSPLNFLDSYKKDFNVAYGGKVKVSGINTDYVVMTPVKDRSLKSVKLYVNAAKKQLVKVEQFGADNSVSVIAVKDYRENQNLSPSLFTFDKSNYKNYIITEL